MASCPICNHSKRGEIDRALLSGLPAADAATLYQLPAEAVAHHRRQHLKPAARDLAIESLGQARESLQAEMKAASAARDHRRVADLSRQLRETTEALARVTGVIGDLRKLTLVLPDAGAYQTASTPASSKKE